MIPRDPNDRSRRNLNGALHSLQIAADEIQTGANGWLYDAMGHRIDSFKTINLNGSKGRVFTFDPNGGYHKLEPNDNDRIIDHVDTTGIDLKSGKISIVTKSRINGQRTTTRQIEAIRIGNKKLNVVAAEPKSLAAAPAASPKNETHEYDNSIYEIKDGVIYDADGVVEKIWVQGQDGKIIGLTYKSELVIEETKDKNGEIKQNKKMVTCYLDAQGKRHNLDSYIEFIPEQIQQSGGRVLIKGRNLKSEQLAAYALVKPPSYHQSIKEPTAVTAVKTDGSAHISWDEKRNLLLVRNPKTGQYEIVRSFQHNTYQDTGGPKIFQFETIAEFQGKKTALFKSKGKRSADDTYYLVTGLAENDSIVILPVGHEATAAAIKALEIKLAEQEKQKALQVAVVNARIAAAKREPAPVASDTTQFVPPKKGPTQAASDITKYAGSNANSLSSNAAKGTDSLSAKPEKKVVTYYAKPEWVSADEMGKERYKVAGLPAVTPSSGGTPTARLPEKHGLNSFFPSLKW